MVYDDRCIIFNIVVLLATLLYLVMFCNYAVAQVNTNTLESLANNTNVLASAQINVGRDPVSILSYREVGVYVANARSDTVSVIDPITNTVTKNIQVGKSPRYIALGSSSFGGDNIYVANYDSDTVSVIDPITNTVTKNIPVGESPTFMRGTIAGHVYVANYDSDTVSVIDPITNTVTKNIQVGKSPVWISSNSTDAYVANSESDTVSLINTETDEVMAGIKFDVSPVRTGQIICNDLAAPQNRFFYVSSETKCVAKPNRGFEFTCWVEDLGNNSTITVNSTLRPLSSPIESLLEVFGYNRPPDPAAI